MVVMKKIRLSIHQDHVKTEEPVRYVKRNTVQVYMDSNLKGRVNQAIIVLILIIQVQKVTVQVSVVQQPPLVR